MQASPLYMANRKISFVRMTLLVIPMVLLLLLSQTVFAQNTYVITDGDTVLVYTSAAADPAAVLDEAGLALDADDTYTTQAALGISEISIQRGRTVTIDCGGETFTVSASQETVGQLLQDMNIDVSANAAVSVDLDETPYDGMEIRVDYTVHSTEVYTTDIPYSTTYCEDPSLPLGEQVLVTEGQNGQLRCTAQVTYRNSQEISRSVVRETMVSQCVNAVIAVGTGDAQEAPSFTVGDGIITLSTGEVLPFTGTMEVKATAYTHTDAGCDLITSTGTTVRVGTVAVDPKVIPYGTRMFIVANDGSVVYGIATAEDCGGSIKGDRVDLYYPTYGECIQFGVRQCTIYFLG